MQGGIYSIRNSIDQKQYIGSSVNLRNRWRAHLSDLRRGQHGNQYLQRAFDKHGEDAFAFSVLEHLEDSSQLLSREQHYLDTLSPEYNILPRAGSPRGHRVSNETRRKMSETQKGERHHMYGRQWSIEARRNMSAAHMGHPVSDEQRRKQSVAMRGERNPNYGKCPSEETRRKIGDAARGRWPSEETRRKMSLAQKARKRHGMSDKHHSAEAKQKMREAALRLWSDDTHRERMRESARRGWIRRKQAQMLRKEEAVEPS